MTAASRDQYRQWVIDALKALGKTTPQEVYRWIQTNCSVPPTDLTGTTADGEPLYKKEIRFARWDLRRSGIVDGSERGIWALT